MAQLINDIAKLRKYLTVNAQFDFNKVLPYVKKVERKYIIPQISFEEYTALVAHNADENSNEPRDRVKILLEEASAYYALLTAIPFLNLQITNFGIKTTETTQSSNADWKEVRDLKRLCLESAEEAIDDALQIMEDAASDFDAWKNSDAYTVFMSSLVRNTKQFEEGFNLNHSRKAFLSVVSVMKEVEEQFLLPMLGAETLQLLKTVSANETIIRVQELSRLAVVALTVAKVATTGKFLFTASSFQLKTEELPWDKTKIGLTPEEKETLRADRQNAGQEYLKKIKAIILENQSLFPDYTDKIETGLNSRIINGKSHLSL